MKRTESGQFAKDANSNIERVFQLVATGETSRARMAERLGLTPEQVRYALVNLTNRKRITVATHGGSKGKGNGKGRAENTYKPWDGETVLPANRRQSVFAGANSIFNLAA